MKKKYLMLLAVPALLLTACGPSNVNSETGGDNSNPTTEVNPQSEYVVTFHIYGDKIEQVNVKAGEKVKKPANPVREGYTFVNWFDSIDGTNEFNFGTKINKNTDIYAKWTQKEKPTINNDTLKKALNQDYSNCQTTFYSVNANELGGGDHWVYNLDGYHAVQGMDGNLGDGIFNFFHDYEGKSHMWWEDKEHGGAWINKGMKLDENSYVDLSMESNYFNPEYVFPKLNANDFILQNGLFHLIDQDIIKSLEAEGTFNYIQDNDIYEIAIQLDETQQYIHKIYTYDVEDPKSTLCTETEIGFIGTTDFTVGTLPPKPSKENVKTWYEWKNEAEPTIEKIKSINLEYLDPAITSCEIGDKVNLKYTFDPIKPDKKDIELLVVSGVDGGVEFKYDFGTEEAPQLTKVTGIIAGEYEVQMHDKLTDVYSNKVKVTIKGTADSKFLNGVYDCTLESDESGTLILFNNLENGKTASYKGSQHFFKVVEGVANGDNPGLDAFTNAFVLSVNNQGNYGDPSDIYDSYVDITLSEAVNAMSFTYGLAYSGHADNIDFPNAFKAYISISSDGVNFDEPIDWTSEIADRATALTVRRKDIRFAHDTTLIRIGFDNKFIGKFFDAYLTTFQFFQEA